MGVARPGGDWHWGVGRVCEIPMLFIGIAVRLRCFHPIVWRRVREALQALKPAQEAMDTTRLNLIVSTPIIPKENVLLIEGIHNLFTGRQPIEELWQKWQQPEIWWLPDGHISALFVAGLTRRVLR